MLTRIFQAAYQFGRTFPKKRRLRWRVEQEFSSLFDQRYFPTSVCLNGVGDVCAHVLPLHEFVCLGGLFHQPFADELSIARQ
jgi:hypothetical protein